ncbi:type II secretion system protein E [Paucilactobacillus oligofermentans DSM 15707 = LMG 22743]|uniref:Type II secretion system protein E n=1 Tax=Paucilactobacillus oligofermentans DSM 15707 = LMG 22743 TaxID=1423778 RepID=A0A0R1RXX8_9LACO|nr:competence type IV pilus ATPase ComGA [Paucilactobacillus oligofermentans]KRL57995.1 type II secretion system protein E [Paucilactobacillus oligofermentans DSM 15707 = LMG 22743]CUS26533.1 ComG operon protein 1 [Paucilactobacillus oligofermentans DSM 15707 = LMG 22743]
MKEEVFSEYLTECINEQASDLYILPKDSGYQLSYHSKLQLTILAEINRTEGLQMINFFKYRANMAVSEHRRPQLGSLKWAQLQTEMNLRLSTVGDFNGEESMVIRFIYPLNQLSHQELIVGQMDQLNQLGKKRGLLLFSGPMGSGKTTTMYQLARKYSQTQVVMTIEDPVEIEESNFIQLQVNQQADMDYDELLRVGLRHRPEVFLIGEIRDKKTAKMAVQAALSGHLVMATVHAKNVYGVMQRMQQLGIEDHYLMQTISGICYQRLITTTEERMTPLYDILAEGELETVFKQINSYVGMTKMWGANLAKLVEDGKITKKTAESFKTG